MKNRYFLSIITIIFISIILVNSIYAAPTNSNAIINSDKNKSKDKILSDAPITDELSTQLEQYQNDSFYPPEDVLQSVGLTTESYIELLKSRITRNVDGNSTVINVKGTSPRSGNVRIPVLLVEFNDRNHNSYMTRDLIDDIFNDPNYLDVNGISVSEFWDKQSYGDLNVTFDVYSWKRLNNDANSTDYNDSFKLGVESIKLFDLNSQGYATVDFSQYDSDDNNRIDGFVIIWASDGTNTVPIPLGETRFLNAWDYNGVDGKKLGNIETIPDISNIYCPNSQAQTGITDCRLPVSLAAHEFGHVLGLPDFYASVGEPLRTTFMYTPRCPNKPINMDVWSRYFLGWVNPVNITTESNITQTLRSINDYPDSIILKNNTLNSNGKEFFIFENRYISTNTENLDSVKCMKYSATSTWGLFTLSTTYNVNGGILAYHVDENYINSHYLDNNVMLDSDNSLYNDTVSHPGIVWEQNKIDVAGYTGQDFYTDGNSGTSPNYTYYKYFDNSNHYFTPDTTTKGYNGLNNNISLEVLSHLGDALTAKFMIAPKLTTAPTASPAGGTFNQQLPLVTLSTVHTGASIYYTLDGNYPTTSSNLYNVGSQITIPAGNPTTTLKAVAYIPGNHYSDLGTFTYTINATTPTPTGPASSEVDYNTTIILNAPDANIYYTTDGNAPDANKILYTSPILIDGTKTIRAKAYRNYWTPSAEFTATYTVSCIPGINADNKYVICSPSDLDYVRSHLTGDYILGKDIDLSSVTNFDPIGVFLNGFTGTFDGDNKTISNLHVNKSSNHAGLFAYVQNATISNVKLTNANISGQSIVGGLVGYNNHGTISNVHVTGDIHGMSDVGGLVGYNYQENNPATISLSSFVGDVEGGGDYIGGLVGSNYEGTINKSYSEGSALGVQRTGGLTGANSGAIQDSYSLSSVDCNEFTGGLVGSDANGTVSNSYSTGAVTGLYGFGGLIGSNYNGTITNSYWNINTSNQTSSDGGFGKTTVQMTNPQPTDDIYVGWNFTNTWRISSNRNLGYPDLIENPSTNQTRRATVVTEQPIVVDNNKLTNVTIPMIIDENIIIIPDQNITIISDVNKVSDENLSKVKE